MLNRLRHALSPSMVVALLALFVALGGVGIAATGGNFILGVPNTATSNTQLTASGATTTSALTLTNNNAGSGSTALILNVPSGHSPFRVNRSTRVTNLNADLLDGLDSTAFVQGGGSGDGQAIAEAPGDNGFLGPAFGGLVRLQYQCPASLASNGFLRIINVSGSVANFFIDSGGANPDYLQLAGGGGLVGYPAAAGGESFHIQAQGGPGVGVIDVGSVHRIAANDCHAQARGEVNP